MDEITSPASSAIPPEVSGIQECLAGMLDDFDRYARKHSLSYFLVGGGLLGAVRHRDFIPWDDDLDICMLRKDYERFVSLVQTDPVPCMIYEGWETNPATPHMHGKLCLAGGAGFLALEHPHLSINPYLGIDIFPLDGVPRRWTARKLNQWRAYFYLHSLLLTSDSCSDRHRSLKAVAAPFLKRFLPMERARKLYLANALRYPAEDAENLVSHAGRYGYKRESFPADWVKKLTTLKFHGRQLPVPEAWHEFLCSHYGENYIQPPKTIAHEPHYIRFSTKKSYDFALIMATRGRYEELAFFLDKLEAARKNFRCQLIVVDQNDDERLTSLLQEPGRGFDILHLHAPPGVSEARNMGLQKADAEIIAFPDDDCFYCPDTLERAAVYFSAHPEIGGILGQWQPPAKDYRSFRPAEINRYSAFFRGETHVQFYRASAIAGLEFDPAFGPGLNSSYPGGEDTDFLLRVLKRGMRVKRLASLHTRHPEADYQVQNPNRLLGYGKSRMAILRKHHYSIFFRLANLLYPLKGMLLKPGHRKYFRHMFKGRLSGF